MFMKKKLFYKCEDYTVRMRIIGDCQHYYLKFHGQTDSPEYEINIDIFKLYYKDFKYDLEKIRNEHRRHIEDGEVDDFIESGKLTVKQFEQECVEKIDFEAALKMCTPIQKRRCKLYVQGYSFTEIARMENCDKEAVRQSIITAVKKIKNIL